MGVGQHLQHLLICITTDTLLDQVNGARNNKGGEKLGKLAKLTLLVNDKGRIQFRQYSYKSKLFITASEAVYLN